MTGTAATGGANPGIVPKWTPGPWEVSESPLGDHDYMTTIELPSKTGQFGAWIASAEHNWNESGAGERRISWKEAESNARLISAAPDLYEALAFMANVARVTPGFSPMAIKQADAAFFKARGEA